VREDFELELRPLWLSAQDGNDAAYRAALGLMASRLRGYFGRRMGGAANEVEDVVQETLLALHLQRGTYDPSIPVTAWLHGIARHKLLDLWRRRCRSEHLLESFDELPESLHPPVYDETDTSRDLATLLDTLPQAQRRSIVDTRLHGLSVAEAARIAGVSESAVKVNVHRGLKRLAAMIRGQS
jgi:RNA polymerase sigma-70 factor (ECF subfamily)